MSRQQTLADAVRVSARPVLMALEGIANADRARQARDLPNHFAWCLGHLALTMHRSEEKIDEAPLPEASFVTGDGRAGDANRFDTESVCFGSTALADADLYPTLPRCRAIFLEAIARIETAALHATDETLDTETTWGAGDRISMHALILRVAVHNGVHAGQMVDLRRAIGAGSMFEG